MSIKFKTINFYAFAAVFLISFSMLTFEILLTRIISLRLFFHFAFLVVSNCLLGIGASGSMISILQNTLVKRERFWIWIFSLLYMFSLVAIYFFILNYDMEPNVYFSSLKEILNFSVFNLLLSTPFFFAGSVIGLVLAFNSERVNKIYSLDLLGAGLGAFFCPIFLMTTGAGGTFIFLTLLALAGAMVATPPVYNRIIIVPGLLFALFGLLILPSLDDWFPVPTGKNNIFITENISLKLGKRVAYSKWSAISRIDVIDVDKDKRIIYGVGKKQHNVSLPEEKFILQDASAGTYISNFSQNPEALEILKYSIYSAAVMLKDKPRVFIIGVGGANDVWAAKINNAVYIKGIEINKQIIDIHKGYLYNFSRDIVNDPRIELVYDEGRSALIRDNSRYDVIQMAGVDTWSALTSGAYVLAENYLYTVEAIQNMYDKLSEGGIISITRMGRDMETLRLLANIYTALKDRNKGDFEKSVFCLHSEEWTRTILVKKGAFSKLELNKLEQFAQKGQLEILYHPQKKMNNIIEDFVRSSNKKSFIKEFPRDMSPTPDDRPYFFKFSKWSQLFSTKKNISEPTFISQGNPFFIFGQLLLSTILAVSFILLPILFFKRKGISHAYLKRFLIYFAGLGLGFIFIEIALMQKLVLFLGHPLYSITVTLFSMLIFAGAGSLLSDRWFRELTVCSWFVPVGLAVFLGLFIIFSPQMVKSWIIWPKFARILVTIGVLAPISMLLGVPFAYGIRLLNQFNPTIIPWAWAVNGCMTVIGSILTVILSMNIGFNFVLVTAILMYFISFFVIRGLS